MMNETAQEKFDGERVMAIKKRGEIFLVNRRGNILNDRFAEIVGDLMTIEEDFIIDGEIVKSFIEEIETGVKQEIKINEVNPFA